MNKKWKDIIGYESIYQISNFGEVKVFSRVVSNGVRDRVMPGKIMKPVLSNGYYKVGLVKENVRIGMLIHRLVALHFIDNPENKPTVNHKDGNKLNNFFDNLEWATQAEQVQHSYRTGLQTPNNTRLVINLQTGIFYDSLIDASKSITHIQHKALFAMVKGYNKNKSSFIFS